MRMNRINRIVLCAILLLGSNVQRRSKPTGEAIVTRPRGGSHSNKPLLTALQQNPDILPARQEIERTKGLFIQLRAAAVCRKSVGTAHNSGLDPHITDIQAALPNRSARLYKSVRGGTHLHLTDRGQPGNLFRRPRAGSNNVLPVSSVTAATTGFAMRSIKWSRRCDSNFIWFCSTARSSVCRRNRSALQSQLQDQQNRFEAGTVPRFNVLQAQVALSNQLPLLITARNNYPHFSAATRQDLRARF